MKMSLEDDLSQLWTPFPRNNRPNPAISKTNRDLAWAKRYLGTSFPAILGTGWSDGRSFTRKLSHPTDCSFNRLSRNKASVRSAPFPARLFPRSSIFFSILARVIPEAPDRAFRYHPIARSLILPGRNSFLFSAHFAHSSPFFSRSCGLLSSAIEALLKSGSEPFERRRSPFAQSPTARQRNLP